MKRTILEAALKNGRRGVKKYGLRCVQACHVVADGEWIWIVNSDDSEHVTWTTVDPAHGQTWSIAVDHATVKSWVATLANIELTLTWKDDALVVMDKSGAELAQFARFEWDPFALEQRNADETIIWEGASAQITDAFRSILPTFRKPYIPLQSLVAILRSSDGGIHVLASDYVRVVVCDLPASGGTSAVFLRFEAFPCWIDVMLAKYPLGHVQLIVDRNRCFRIVSTSADRVMRVDIPIPTTYLRSMREEFLRSVLHDRNYISLFSVQSALLLDQLPFYEQALHFEVVPHEDGAQLWCDSRLVGPVVGEGFSAPLCFSISSKIIREIVAIRPQVTIALTERFIRVLDANGAVMIFERHRIRDKSM